MAESVSVLMDSVGLLWEGDAEITNALWNECLVLCGVDFVQASGRKRNSPCAAN